MASTPSDVPAPVLPPFYSISTVKTSEESLRSPGRNKNVRSRVSQVSESSLEFLIGEMVEQLFVNAIEQYAPTKAGEAEEEVPTIASTTIALSGTQRESIYLKLEMLGFRVGYALSERLSRERPRFTDTLDIVKFICKDMWMLMFSKQIDNLKTNHRGVYVLQDNTFRWFTRMSTERGSQDGATRAMPYLWFPCGIIRGALQNLGVSTVVLAETSNLPQSDVYRYVSNQGADDIRGRDRPVIIAISGPSCSGKTTLTKSLKFIFKNSILLHQDDFYKPDSEIPISPIHNIADWDCEEAIDFIKFQNTIEYVQKEGKLPPSFKSIEDQNISTDDEMMTSINSNVLSQLQHRTSKITYRFIFVDGFLLLSHPKLSPLLDVKILTIASRKTLQLRRESRTYTTSETIWADPPNYFDNIVWPSYIKHHSYLFQDHNDIEKGNGDNLIDTSIMGLSSERLSIEDMLIRSTHFILKSISQ